LWEQLKTEDYNLLFQFQMEVQLDYGKTSISNFIVLDSGILKFPIQPLGK